MVRRTYEHPELRPLSEGVAELGPLGPLPELLPFPELSPELKPHDELSPALKPHKTKPTREHGG